MIIFAIFLSVCPSNTEYPLGYSGEEPGKTFRVDT